MKATDGGSGVKSVEIYNNGKDIGSATQVGATSYWTLAATGLANGANTFDAVVTDKAGNASTLPSSQAVTDLIQPTGVSSITQSATGAWTPSTSDTLTVSASSSNSTVKSVEVYDYVNGSSTATDLGAATKQGDGIWTFNATNLADGTHSFAAVATDTSGNTSTLASSPSGAPVDKVDQTAPVVSGVAQSATGSWTNAPDTITVTVSDATSGVNTVEIYEDGTFLSNATASNVDSNGNGTYTYTASGLTNGTHTFAAVATDSAGNASTLASSPTQTELVQPTGVTAISQSATGETKAVPDGSTIWTAPSTSDVITVTTSSTSTVTVGRYLRQRCKITLVLRALRVATAGRTLQATSRARTFSAPWPLTEPIRPR